MIQFLQKLLFLWEKKMHLTRVRCERAFVLEQYGDKVKKDLAGLRSELSNLRSIKEPQTKTKEKILKIEQEINESMQYKQMIHKGNLTENELKGLIKNVWKNLF